VSVLPFDEMAALVERQMRERILGYLGLANRAGNIISGSSLVCDAIRGDKKPGLALVAVDVSGSIGEKIISLAALHHVHAEKIMTKDEFGAILGKSLRSAVAVKQGGFVVRLASVIERYRNFLGEV
jgi:ribosomal protein L7Ae-like RNA K-turn-binding protein